jgi:histidine triad (HIT) family protein
MDDFYCKEILSGLTKVDVVFETKYALAFHHTKPYWPVHIVVIPKKHILSLTTADPDLLGQVLSTVQQSAKHVLETREGCEVLTNMGSYQDTKHMHWHVISGKPIRQLTTETLVQ